MWLPMHIQTVGLTEPEHTPLLLLRETTGQRCLALGIGEAEAMAITLARTQQRPPRPLTHDLLGDVIRALGTHVEQVRITELREETFYAELVFPDNTIVSARPSDAVALAVRTETPLVADDTLLAEHGIPAGDITDETAASPQQSEDQIAQFRTFLDQISPEDFGDNPP
ncbi:bifunctional DNase/RNase [Haloactinomyces albus]|uniref:Bifunctional DNase/RNase n=2 Tax=Haloactinomyces albus TaxID=1352928 RepID=A0AAE3ZHS6_9ACTN|nr:bifunctional DNase/RNase [Haloactinomyces albus]